MNTLAARLFVLATISLLTLLPGARGQTTPVYTTLYDLPGGAKGELATGGVVQGNDGNFYGPTSQGGDDYNDGTIFRFTPAGVFTTIYSFTGLGHGAEPSSALVKGDDGNFYGTAFDRDGGRGVVYSITPAGVYMVLHLFPGGVDEESPTSELRPDGHGSFYGAADTTLYTITPAGDFHVFYTFPDEDEYPSAPLRASDGSFYGTTQRGGAGGLGTIYRLTPDGTFTVLHTFTGGDTDGAMPRAGLIQGNDGNFYGTTHDGGPSDVGVAYSITPAGVFTVLHYFNLGVGDGAEPTAALLLGRDGNFYGTTSYGGSSNGYGTVFRMTPAGVVTILHAFTASGTEGFSPQSALIQGTDGNLYGTTFEGGTADAGTIFEVTLPPASAGNVQFAAATVNATENAGSVTLTVQRAGGSAGAITVDFATADGSAVAGMDYTATGGTLAWADGDTADKTISVPILDRDLSNGSTKTFTVSLGNATGGTTVGTPASASVNILDDDAAPAPTPAPPTPTPPVPVPLPSFTSPPAVSTQIKLPFLYAVTATNQPTSYAADGLPAGLSLDPATGLITGVPTTAGTFAVALSAANAGGASAGTLTLTVFAPTVNLAVGGDGAAMESGENGVVVVTRTGDTSLPLTVFYKVKGDAVAGVDYKKLPGTLTIPAGAAKAKVKVKPIDGSPGAGVLKVKIVLLPSPDGSYVVGVGLAKIKLIGR